MSEAEDAERDVEDFFNEQILGVTQLEEKQDQFPTEAPPEPKPVEEIAVDPDVPETPEEVSDTPPEDAPEQGESVSETPEEVSDAPEDDAHLAWARKKYGEGIDLENETSRMLAKAAYEQERMIGKQAEERRRLEQEAQAREIQQKIDFLNSPGALTPEEDAWIDEAVSSGDAATAADALLNEGRADLYGAFIARWVQQGDREAMEAIQHRDRVMAWVQTPEPSETESYTLALGQTFQSLGMNIESHGPVILAKAEELGVNHPSVQGMMSQDPDVRRIATRAVYDLATQGQVAVRKAKTDDVVAQRVQEERLRQGAAGITNGGSRPEEKKKSAFWDKFDEEIEERGWDGNRPQYGRE